MSGTEEPAIIKRWKACDPCRMRKVRCSGAGSLEDPRCRNCKKHQLTCTFHHASQKPPPRERKRSRTSATSSHTGASRSGSLALTSAGIPPLALDNTSTQLNRSHVWSDFETQIIQDFFALPHHNLLQIPNDYYGTHFATLTESEAAIDLLKPIITAVGAHFTLLPSMPRSDSKLRKNICQPLYERAYQQLVPSCVKPTLLTIHAVRLLAAIAIEYGAHHIDEMSFAYNTTVRHCLINGLHLEATYEQMDPETARHSRNLWWTMFVVDSLVSSSSGSPLVIGDEDFDIDPPSLLQGKFSPNFDFKDVNQSNDMRLMQPAMIDLALILRRYCVEVGSPKASKMPLDWKAVAEIEAALGQWESVYLHCFSLDRSLELTRARALAIFGLLSAYEHAWIVLHQNVIKRAGVSPETSSQHLYIHAYRIVELLFLLQERDWHHFVRGTDVLILIGSGYHLMGRWDGDPTHELHGVLVRLLECLKDVAKTWSNTQRIYSGLQKLTQAKLAQHLGEAEAAEDMASLSMNTGMPMPGSLSNAVAAADEAASSTSSSRRGSSDPIGSSSSTSPDPSHAKIPAPATPFTPVPDNPVAWEKIAASAHDGHIRRSSEPYFTKSHSTGLSLNSKGGQVVRSHQPSPIDLDPEYNFSGAPHTHPGVMQGAASRGEVPNISVYNAGGTPGMEGEAFMLSPTSTPHGRPEMQFSAHARSIFDGDAGVTAQLDVWPDLLGQQSAHVAHVGSSFDMTSQQQVPYNQDSMAAMQLQMHQQAYLQQPHTHHHRGSLDSNVAMFEWTPTGDPANTSNSKASTPSRAPAHALQLQAAGLTAAHAYMLQRRLSSSS